MSDALPRPPFDPDLTAALAELAAGSTPVTTETLEQRRAPVESPADLTSADLEAAGLIRRDVTVPGHEGAPVTLSIIQRADHTVGPGLYHLHGGGMILGTRFSGTRGYLDWITELDAVLVTAEYRLAPEFPDPTPVEDAYAGLVWTAEHAKELGIDRLFGLGSSAGGGLMAGCALLARDRRGPELAGQVLLCPMLDDRQATASQRQFGSVYAGWDSRSNAFGWAALLGDTVGGPDVSVYAAPARATDLVGLPPTYLDCGTTDLFRDEDVAFASALLSAGVDTELHLWAGGFHGFELCAPQAPVSIAAHAARTAWLRRRLAR